MASGKKCLDQIVQSTFYTTTFVHMCVSYLKYLKQSSLALVYISLAQEDTPFSLICNALWNVYGVYFMVWGVICANCKLQEIENLLPLTRLYSWKLTTFIIKEIHQEASPPCQSSTAHLDNSGNSANIM